MNKVKQAHERNKDRLMRYPNVVAVYMGKKCIGGTDTHIDCVKVGVKEKIPRDQLRDSDVIPKAVRAKWYSMDTVMTDVQQLGEIVALQDRASRIRPVPGGVSVGHRDITAGTLGCWIVHEGRALMLSNNHVLANTNRGSTGDPIVQPGPADGGRLGEDAIGLLFDFVPIAFDGFPIPDECRTAQALAKFLNWCCRVIQSKTVFQAVDRTEPNYVDVALGMPSSDQIVMPVILGSKEKPPIKISGLSTLVLGDRVAKSGRTTGWTTGTVTGIHATIQVSYGVGQVATFEDQLLIDPAGFSAGGDSGSAILKDGSFGLYGLGGLLFAGSEEVTIANPIQRVSEKFPLSVA